MRIAHVIPTYVPAFRYGGPVRSVHGLAEAQARAGDEVTVFTSNADGPAALNVPLDREVRLGLHGVRYHAARFPRRLAHLPSLRETLRREIGDFDVGHLHSTFLLPTLSAARAARAAGTPYFISPRGMLDPDLIQRRGALRKRLWIALFERRTLAGAARIVVTSRAEADAIGRLGLALAPIAIVPNGVDLEELGPPEPESVSPHLRAVLDRGPYALSLGRLSWKKGVGLALEAVSRLPGGRMVIAGPDDEGLGARIRDRIEELGVAGRVDLLGEVSGADRAVLLRGARVLVMASVSENFGNSALEALACGVPVVVTDGVGLADEVRRAGAGRVAVADAAKLAEALSSYLSDAEAAHVAGECGRRLVEASFTWKIVAARMRSVYEEVLATWKRERPSPS